MDSTLKHVLESSGELNTLIARHGDSSVHDYFKRLNTNTTKISTDLAGILLSESESLGYKVNKTDFNRPFLLHTADHIGIINHPFFWSSKAGLLSATHSNEPIIVLATGNISPSNSSYPRSLFWHNSKLVQQRVHLYPLSSRRFAMYGLPALTSEELRARLTHINAPEKLQKAVEKLTQTPELYSKKWLDEQLCILSSEWWKINFGPNQSLQYFELENIVAKLMLLVIKDSNSNIYKLLFDGSVTENYIKSFDGVRGAHNSKTQKGSELFWYLDHKNKTRHRITVKNGLMLTDKKLRIDLNPANVEKLLFAREIMPTLALSYSLLSFEHNATLAGGFAQIDYLGDMQRAWTKVFPKRKVPSTNIFAGEIGLVGLKKKDKWKLASLADLYIRTDSFEQRLSLCERASRQSLERSVDAISDMLLKILDPANKNYDNSPPMESLDA